ncbi:hypothetical protein OB236_32335 [Paenibacillus sp. WQ 127069]|uniref:Uncharacterized protein n=1 Tax=Paenibacillus baimaensis TaxID=2982185 RepID=A0ABT2UT25_9BACL|nr:hypothetical protein [Paenibacillus sp. WQ 127069]MCU6796824.1 hypothetical protein [Paenibacillus sp. WQ 127069]
MNLQLIITNLSRKRTVFHNEADFQHALSWEIRECYPDAKIRLEIKVHGANTKVYLDILVHYEERKYAIELKYKTRTLECFVEDEEFSLNNHGAQDVGRYDVLKDLQRLERMVTAGVVDQGYLVFLTNDSSYYSDPQHDKQTADKDFRIHEGSIVHGQLNWNEQTGIGTMKGREQSIILQFQYDLKWVSYSHIGDSSRGDFRYLLSTVEGVPRKREVSQSVPVQPIPIKSETEVVVSADIESNIPENWFRSFSLKGEIPLSQVDLRDKIVSYLLHVGYMTQINRELGTDKIDIWAVKGNESIAIEIRYKTSLLQTMYRGQYVHLKNQGAQDISRYDFVKDLSKVERVVLSRPNVKGYALLITNDQLYWQIPKKHNSVDAAFHVYDGNTVCGICSWKDVASSGTILGREEPIHFSGSYQLRWQPYLSLGSNKNECFQALLIEVCIKG